MSYAQTGAHDWRWKRMSKRDRHRENLERLAMLRHMGPPYGGGPMFGHPFGGGRGRRRRGDVRTALLMALAEEPRNGYQLMQVIEERSGGRWRPSPGSVYPALAQLEDEGLIRSSERDGAKLFEITDLGREQLEQRRTDTPPWKLDDAPGSEPFVELLSLTQQIHLAAVQVAQAGDARQVAQAAETLTEARRTLYRILAEDTAPDAEDTAAPPDRPGGDTAPAEGA
jgi:DNA-binding PadR family transcriptional regulator